MHTMYALKTKEKKKQRIAKFKVYIELLSVSECLALQAVMVVLVLAI